MDSYISNETVEKEQAGVPEPRTIEHMQANQHLIVYAAPAHAGVRTVECSCGWSATADPSDESSYDVVLKGLLDQWLEHATQPSGDSA